MEDTKELEKEADQKRGDSNFPFIKLTLVVLSLSLGVFLLWAAFYPLRQGAPAHGVVVVSGYRKVHQHPYGGVIKEILVKEGDLVKKGQPLITFEDTEIRAQFMQARAEYFSLSLQKARLLAEKSQQPTFSIPKELSPYISDPELMRIYQAQKELFQARRAKLENEKRLLQETILGLTDYISSLKNQYNHLQSQLETLEKQITSLSPLTEAGYYPRNRLLDLQRQAEATRAQLAEISGNLKRAETSLREAKQRLHLLEREYQKDVETELAEVEKRLLMVKESYTTLLDRMEKTTLRAQETGRVMNLRFHASGAVVKPAEPILEILPENSTLIVEAKLSPLHIEEVRPGQEVDLYFPALDPKKTPVLRGKLIYISPDIQYDDFQGQRIPYYLLRVELDPASIKEITKLGKELVPGMPAEVIVKTGERTFLSYLIKPFWDRLSRAFLK